MFFTDTITEAVSAGDTVSAQLITNPALVEAASASDVMVGRAVDNPTLAEVVHAQETLNGVVFYYHGIDRTQHIELRSIHDVLTNREFLSDPTGMHDLPPGGLLRTQKARWSR